MTDSIFEPGEPLADDIELVERTELKRALGGASPYRLAQMIENGELPPPIMFTGSQLQYWRRSFVRDLIAAKEREARKDFQRRKSAEAEKLAADPAALA